jgi:hypothetical protein
MSPITKDDIHRLLNIWLELSDEVNLLRLKFLKDGYVAVTMGVRNGPIAGPVMYWSLTRNGILRVTYNRRRFPWNSEKPFLEWTGIKFSSDTLTVETSGGLQVFTMEALSGADNAT